MDNKVNYRRKAQGAKLKKIDKMTEKALAASSVAETDFGVKTTQIQWDISEVLFAKSWGRSFRLENTFRTFE